MENAFNTATIQKRDLVANEMIHSSPEFVLRTSSTAEFVEIDISRDGKMVYGVTGNTLNIRDISDLTSRVSNALEYTNSGN